MKRISTITRLLGFFLLLSAPAMGQNTIKGIVLDAASNEPLIGAGVVIQGTTEGTVSDWDGSFEFTTEQGFPMSLEVSYVGYDAKVVDLASNQRMEVSLEESAVAMEAVEVKASRISDKQKESPLTVEAMDAIAIKETPAVDFYDGLGALKGVDLTAASLGFKVINTRGFNSTSPVRSLQIIDGIDNQAPGLNFSLGNFLGSSELDVNKVEIIVGASSAFYGPNAFNGVISMQTKDPFYKTGLSASVRAAERNLLKGAARWAQAINNKDNNPVFAYKLNLEYFRADDWEAENYDPITDSEVAASNPGRYDAVNIYGDDYKYGQDLTTTNPWNTKYPLGVYYRSGYREKDLVNYDTENLKANVGFHFRLQPSKKEQSPEFKIGTNFGAGTTVYQGDNRFSLKNITFLQNTLEFSKRNKYFVRAYTTRTGAGDSYDPYFTALALQDSSKVDGFWSSDYEEAWTDIVTNQRLNELGYPQFAPGVDITDDANAWMVQYADSLLAWHNQARDYADTHTELGTARVPFFAPGTERFDEKFNEIVGKYRTEGGTRFYDNSSLYHVHGEYVFTPDWMDKITTGVSGRIYTPQSKGTVFSDTADVSVINREFGVYTGLERSFYDKQLKLQATFRTDKNENFDWLFSPAASIVYAPKIKEDSKISNTFIRASFSSAVRNPTLSDQYLYLNVGPAILSGNLDGVKDLVTLESLRDALENPIATNPEVLDSFNVAPIRPERVRTFELGIRTSLFSNVYVDAGYYYSIYKDFIGYQIGVDILNFDLLDFQPYRYAANSDNRVTTQGLSVGINYYFAGNYSFNGNYSWNKLVETVEDDPIIPAFNTPEHKFNIGLSSRNINIGKAKGFGFSVNYKWVEGFLFEGSPQFTGFVPSYDMLDAQVNYRIPKIDTTVKIGASNLLDNRKFQTYGGPRIGRMAYIQLTYQP